MFTQISDISNTSTADTDLTKSWVTTVRFSEDLCVQMDAKERTHAPPVPASTLETSSSSVSNDLDLAIPLDGNIEMASESAANTPTEAVPKRKRKRGRSVIRFAPQRPSGPMPLRNYVSNYHAGKVQISAMKVTTSYRS